jgi:hypothetical protein
VGDVLVHSSSTYCPAGHDKSHVCHRWSSVVVPVHGLSVKDLSSPPRVGLGVHGWQLVVSWAVSPEHLSPEMNSSGLHATRQSAHVLSKRVLPVQKPTMYWPGGLASNERHLPLHFAQTLSLWSVELHSCRMY